jgi:hypothetical protein
MGPTGPPVCGSGSREPAPGPAISPAPADVSRTLARFDGLRASRPLREPVAGALSPGFKLTHRLGDQRYLGPLVPAETLLWQDADPRRGQWRWHAGASLRVSMSPPRGVGLDVPAAAAGAGRIGSASGLGNNGRCAASPGGLRLPTGARSLAGRPHRARGPPPSAGRQNVLRRPAWTPPRILRRAGGPGSATTADNNRLPPLVDRANPAGRGWRPVGGLRVLGANLDSPRRFTSRLDNDGRWAWTACGAVRRGDLRGRDRGRQWTGSRVPVRPSELRAIGRFPATARESSCTTSWEDKVMSRSVRPRLILRPAPAVRAAS